jgi:hypothetical protein
LKLLDKVFGKVQEGAESQTEDKKKLVTYVRDRVEEVRGSASRIAQEATWLTNTAYLLGFDQVYYDSQTKQFRSINNQKNPLALNRIHVNMILPTVQNRLAKLCKNPPKYDVLPESTSSEDKDSARLALQVLNMLWERLHMNKKRINLLMLAMQAGHAYLKVHWDPTKGRLIKNPLTGELMFEGDVDALVRSAFSIFSDPLATTDDESKWKVEANVRRLSYFKETYENGHMVKEEDVWLLSLQFESQLNNMSSSGSGGNTQTVKGSAIELIYYEKPSVKHPRGRMIVTANGVLLENKELPVGKIPLVKFDDITIGGKFYPEAIITHLRPVQDSYNELLRKREQWVRRLLSGKIIAPRDAGLTEESLRSDQGEVVSYDHKPGAPEPKAMDMPNIPAYAYEEEDRKKQQFDEISGINAPSKGQMPSAGTPAIGMQMLVEADDTRIGIETEGHEIGYAQAGQLLLEYVQAGYKTSRLLKSAGTNLEYAVEEFKGEDLRNNTDVICTRGSTLPGSKTLKRQELLNAYSQGLLGDPADPVVRQKVFAQLEFAFLGELWQDQALSEAQIKRHIEKIEAGEEPEVHELDNHDMAIVRFNRIRISDKFQTYEPKVQKILEDQIEMHIQAAMRLTSPTLAAEEKITEEMKTVEQEIAQNPELQAQLDQMSPEDEPNMADEIPGQEAVMQ